MKPTWTPSRWFLPTTPSSSSDVRTTDAELRAARALLRGARPRWLCPSQGYDVARATRLPHCCAAGRHPDMSPRWWQVRLVVEAVDGPGLPLWWGQSRLIDMVVDAHLVLDPQDHTGWRWWATAYVSRWLRDMSSLYPNRRLRVTVADVDQPGPNGRRNRLLCPTFDLVYGPSWWEHPTVSWWPQCPELRRLTAAALLES